MARINTNVASLAAQRGLSRSQRTLDATLQRLSSGLRINRGADDPAGLIASEGLRSEISGINQAIDNSSRASNVISVAEGALGEVASLLLNVKSLIVQAANGGALTAEEVAANQLQVDSAVQSITRISNTTTFAGLQAPVDVGELLADALERGVAVALAGEDVAQPVDVAPAELAVARRRTRGLDQPLRLQEPDLGVRDIGEVGAQLTEDVPDAHAPLLRHRSGHAGR